MKIFINYKLELNYIIIYLMYLNSILGLILTTNNLTNYMNFLTAIITIIIFMTTRSKVFSEFLFFLGLILFVAFSTQNFLI
jgi:hypothetical protein